jgi:nitrate reductase NapE component
MAEIWWRQVDKDEWDGGSPGGHKSECRSRYFLPPNASCMSCCSSKSRELPFLLVSVLVVGLLAAGGFGEALGFSVWFLSLVAIAGGILGIVMVLKVQGLGY